MKYSSKRRETLTGDGVTVWRKKTLTDKVKGLQATHTQTHNTSAKYPPRESAASAPQGRRRLPLCWWPGDASRWKSVGPSSARNSALYINGLNAESAGRSLSVGHHITVVRLSRSERKAALRCLCEGDTNSTRGLTLTIQLIGNVNISRSHACKTLSVFAN